MLMLITESKKFRQDVRKAYHETMRWKKKAKKGNCFASWILFYSLIAGGKNFQDNL